MSSRAAAATRQVRVGLADHVVVLVAVVVDLGERGADVVVGHPGGSEVRLRLAGVGHGVPFRRGSGVAPEAERFDHAQAQPRRTARHLRTRSKRIRLELDTEGRMRGPVSVSDQQTVPAAVFRRRRGGQAIGRECKPPDGLSYLQLGSHRQDRGKLHVRFPIELRCPCHERGCEVCLLAADEAQTLDNHSEGQKVLLGIGVASLRSVVELELPKIMRIRGLAGHTRRYQISGWGFVDPLISSDRTGEMK